jgi:hypothetical protein
MAAHSFSIDFHENYGVNKVKGWARYYSQVTLGEKREKYVIEGRLFVFFE